MDYRLDVKIPFVDNHLSEALKYNGTFARFPFDISVVITYANGGSAIDVSTTVWRQIEE